MDQSSVAVKPWYKKGWGVVIMLLGGFVLLYVVYIGVLTVKTYRGIQLGEIPLEVQGRLTRGNIRLPGNLKENLAYSLDRDPTFGLPASPLQIVEFADFECPWSRDESLVVRELQARFPDKIYFIYRDFPLEDIHPHAFRAAEAAGCAADQGKFWAMHDKLFQNPERLADTDLKLLAIEVGLDIVQFNECFDGRKYKDEIEVDRADGIAAGVSGTPTFFINGRRVPGAIPMELWEQIISRVR